MSLLQKAINATQQIEGASGIAQALERIRDANTGVDVAAAASQLVGELALAGAITAGVRTAMSGYRLGLAITGNIWKWDAISYAAGAAGSITAGKIIDAINDQNPGGRAYDWLHPDPLTNTNYRNALPPPVRRDPLAIDLDGDGIETVGITATPILFDHNADGIRTGTGWVKADDAWLVLDRDGNGLIDSGRELFGVDTLLSGTPGVDAVYASTGFAALAALNSNGDGVFNASDAAFAQVRLWQDLNQDGISQSTELFTLAQKNIASIGLTPTTSTVNLGNGNTVTAQATVTRTNGTTTQIDSVAVGADSTAGNLNLANNPFYREFTDSIPLTAAALALPEMAGSGVVRDLREAMSFGAEQTEQFARNLPNVVTKQNSRGLPMPKITPREINLAAATEL